MTAVDIPFHHVIVTAPTDRLNGWRVATPTPDSFNPHYVRIAPATNIRPGDVLLGTCDPHYNVDLTPRTDRAQHTGYFAGTPKPQNQGARPFNPNHCDWCDHHYHCGLRTDQGYVTVDGCTPYSPDTLLLVIPRELAQTVTA
ncbi:hypothetical protein ACFV3R_24950 [Streptomyces sp. NPDC059740]|uniref:hypothetical protein n=1 Tax=Streptomyces sp. NPDC059740 TaxID=3346926 RepID=UPI0036609B93